MKRKFGLMAIPSLLVIAIFAFLPMTSKAVPGGTVAAGCKYTGAFGDYCTSGSNRITNCVNNQFTTTCEY